MIPPAFRPLLRTVLVPCLAATLCNTTAQDLDSLRSAWHDASLPDTARLKACHRLIWDGPLYSAPDSAFQLAEEMMAFALHRELPYYEAMATDAQAAVWYVRGEFARALETYEGSRVIYERIGNVNGLASVITNMANMHYFMGAKDKAIGMLEEGYHMHEEVGDSVSMANDLNSIGSIHMMRGDHARAIAFFARCLRIQKAMGGRKGERSMSTTLSNIAGLHMAQGDHHEAITQYTAALRLAEKIGDRHLVAKALMEIGTCLQELGDTTAALDHFQRSLAEREALGDQYGISSALNKLGELQRIKGDPRTAGATFRRSAAIARELEAPYNESVALTGLGLVLLERGRATEALAIAQQALTAADAAEEISQRRDAADLNYRVLKKLRRTDEAIAMLELSVALNDSVMREENQREVLRHEYAYAYEQQAMADSLRHQEEKHALELDHMERLAGERNRRNLLVAALIMAVLIALGIWARMRHRARTARAIMDAQARLAESEKQREAERIRAHIAGNIHDDLGSDLTKLGLLGSRIERAATEHDTVRQLAARVVDLSHEATVALGDIVWAADPHQDTAQGLVARCSTYAHRMLEGTGMEHELRFVHEGHDRTLDPGLKHDVFLLLKEAVHNAVKHAGARRIEASLITGAERFSLRVQDDGAGYDPATVKRGNGLRSMQARAAEIGARMTIATAPGVGCTVTVEGPLDPPPTQ